VHPSVAEREAQRGIKGAREREREREKGADKMEERGARGGFRKGRRRKKGHMETYGKEMKRGREGQQSWQPRLKNERRGPRSGLHSLPGKRARKQTRER